MNRPIQQWLCAAMAVMMAVSQLTTLPAWSATAPATKPASSALNLSSRAASTTAASIQNFQPVAIRVGGRAVLVKPATLLTPAESVAVQQVLQTGKQQIILGPAGNAVGGSFILSGRNLQLDNALAIPKGVTGVLNINTGTGAAISGALTNAGQLYLVSPQTNLESVGLSAQSLSNARGALITTNLPAPLFVSGLGTLNGRLSLDLNIAGSLTNAGSISSANRLTISAGDITNAGAAIHASRWTPPTITASGDLSLLSTTGNITNHGLIQSRSGDVSIASAGAILNLDSTRGVIQSPGTILLQTRATSDAALNATGVFAALMLNGGDLISRRVWFDSTRGQVSVDAHRITGLVDVSGSTAYVGSRVGDLHINSLNLTGDPLFYAQGGNLDLTGAPLINGSTYSTAGGDFVARATGNIVAPGIGSATTIDATSAGGNGRIKIAAGVTFTTSGGASPIGCTDCSPNYTITGVSGTGGNVVLPNVSLKTANNTISVEAHSGGSNAGTIQLSDLSTDSTTGDGGDITVLGSGNVTLGRVSSTASGLGNSAGNISIKSTGGAISTQGNRIDAGAAMNGNGANITLDSGTGVFSLGSLYTRSSTNWGSDICCGNNTGSGTSGTITFKVAGTAVGNANISFANGSEIGVDGSNASASPSLSFNLTAASGAPSTISTYNAGAGNGGNVTITGSGNVTLSSVYTGSMGHNAGNISITAPGAISTQGGRLDAGSGGNGNGGNITLDSGTNSFSLGSLYTRSSTNWGSDICCGNNTGTGTSGTITFKVGGVSVANANLSFANGSEIGVDGSNAVASPSLSFNLAAGSGSLSTICTTNAGAGNGGNVIINGLGNVTTGSIYTGSTGHTAGDITITAAGSISTQGGRLDAGSGMNGNGGNIVVDSATNSFSLGSLYTRSSTNWGSDICCGNNTGTGTSGTITFKVAGVPTSSANISFANGSEIGVDGSNAIASPSLSFNLVAGSESLSTISTVNAGLGNGGDVTITGSGNVTTGSIYAGSNGHNAGNISITAVGSISTQGGRLDAGSAMNGNGGNITLDSGTNTFSLGSLYTRSSTSWGSDLCCGNDTGSGSSGMITFKVGGVATNAANISFANGSEIGTDGTNPGGIAPLSFNVVATSGRLGTIEMNNAGGNGGSLTINGAGNLTVGDIYTNAAGAGNTAGNITITSVFSLTTGNVDAGGLLNANGGNILLDSANNVFTLNSLYTRSTLGSGSADCCGHNTGTGNAGTISFANGGVATNSPMIVFGNGSEVMSDGSNAGTTPDINLGFAGGSLGSVSTFNAGTGSSGSINITGFGTATVIVGDVNTMATTAGQSSGDITIRSNDRITATGDLLAAGLNNASGGNITLNSDISSFALGSLVTRSATGTNVSSYLGGTGSGLPGQLVFKSNGLAIANPGVGFAGGSAILLDGTSAGSTSGLSVVLTNNYPNYPLGDVATVNFGSGPAGSVNIRSCCAISLSNIYTSAFSQAGSISILSVDGYISSANLVAAGMNNGKGGNITLDAGGFSLGSLVTRSTTVSDPRNVTFNNDTGSGTAGLLTFQSAGVPQSPARVFFVNNSSILVDGTNAGSTSTLNIDLVAHDGPQFTQLKDVITINRGAGAPGNVTLAANEPFTINQVITSPTSVAGNVNLSAYGNLTTTSSILAANATLTSNAGSNGSISIGGNIIGALPGSVVSITAAGTGNITQSSNAWRITSATVNLTTGTGNIGTGAQPIQTNTPLMSANTSGAGFVNLNNIQSVVFNNSTAGTNFTIDNSGDVSVAAGQTLTSPNYNVSTHNNGDTVTIGSNVIVSGSMSVTNYGANARVLVPAGQTAQADVISFKTNIVQNDGTIRAIGAGPAFIGLYGMAGGLTINGTGNVTIAQLSANGINVYGDTGTGTTGYLTLNGAQTYNSGGTPAFIVFGGSTMTVNAMQTSTGTGLVSLMSDNMTLANNAGFHALVGNIRVVNSATANTSLTVASGSTGLLTADAGTVSVGLNAAGNVAFAGGGTVNMNGSGGGFIFTTGAGSTISTTAGTTVNSSNGLTVSVDGGATLSNAGTLASTTAGSLLLVQGNNNVTVNGGGTLRTSAATVNVTAATNTLLLGSQTFDPGAGGSTTLVGGGLNVTANAILTFSSGNLARFNSSNIKLGDGVQINSTSASLPLTFGGTSGSTTIGMDGGGIVANPVATITTAGAGINFSPAAGGALTFNLADVSATSGRINMSGGPVTATQSGAGSITMTVGAGITLSSTTAMTFNVNTTDAATFRNDGTVSSSAGGNAITIRDQSANNSSLIIDGAGTYGVTSGILNIDGSTSTTGLVSFVNKTQTITGGGNVVVTASSVRLDSGAALTATGASNITFQPTGLGSMAVNVNGAAGAVAASIGTNGGAINFSSTGGQSITFGFNGGATSANLNFTGGTVTATSNGANNANITVNSAVAISSVGSVNFNVNDTGTGTFTNNGSITISGAGNSITIQEPSATNTGLTLAGTPTYTTTASGSVNFIDSVGTGKITFPATTQTIAGGGSVNLTSPILVFTNGGAINATGASTFNLTSPSSLSVQLTRASAGLATATLTTAGGAINLTPAVGSNLGISLAGSATSGLLNLNGGLVTTTTSGAGVTTIAANTTLSSNNSILVQVAGNAGYANNGTITSTQNGGTITLLSSANLSVGGLSGTLSFTGGASGTITASAGSNTLTFTGPQTFSPGPIGTTKFAGATIVLNSGVTETIGSGTLTFDTNLLDLQNGSAITTSGSSTILNLTSSSGNLTVAVDGAGTPSAQITTDPAQTANITAAGTITFDKLGGATGATLQFNGGNVVSINNAATSVNAGVTLLSNTAFTFNVNGNNTFTNNGVVRSSKSTSGATITVLGAGGTLTMAGTGTFDQTGATMGTTLFASSSALAVNNNAVYTISGGGAVNLSTPVLTMNNGSQINATGNSAITLSSFAANSDLTINLGGAASSTATIATGSSGSISVTPNGLANLAFGLSGGTTAGTLNLNTTGGSGSVSTTTGAGMATTISSGFTLTSNSNLTANINGGTLNLSGTLSSSRPSAQLTVASSSGMTINSNSGVIGVTGGGSSDIHVNIAPANLLSLNGTLNFGAPGDTVVFIDASGADIAVAPGALINGGNAFGFSFHANNLTLGANSTIANSGTFLGAANIILPDSASATISGTALLHMLIVTRSPGLLGIGDTLGENFSITKAAGGGTSTLNITGAGQIWSDTRSANMTIASGVTINSAAPTNIFNVDDGSFIDNGTIIATAPAASIQISTGGLFGGGGNLTLSGTPVSIATTGGGATNITVSTGIASAVTIASNYTFNSSAGGTVTFNAQTAGASFNIGANATATALGGALTVSTPLLTFGNNGAIVGPSVTVNSGGANPLTISGPVSGAASISTTGGALAITPTTGQALNFSKSAGAGTFTLNLSGGPITTTTTNADTNINAGVKLAPASSMTFNVNNATFSDSGTITSSVNGGTLIVQSTGNLTLAGNPQTISMIGTGTNDLQILPGANSTLNINSSYTFSAGADGAVFIFDSGAGGVINLAASKALTMTSGVGLTVEATNISLGAASSIDAGSSPLVLGFAGGALTLPDSSSATISGSAVNAGGYTSGHPAGGFTVLGVFPAGISIVKAAGAGTTTLNVNSANYSQGAFGGSHVIGSGVTISGNGNMTFTEYGPGFTDNGTITSTANSGVITITGGVSAPFGSTSLTLDGTPGSISVTGGGSPRIRVIGVGAGPVNLNANYTFNPGANGIASIQSDQTGASVVAASNVTTTVTSGSLYIDTPSLNFGAGSVFTAPTINIDDNGLANNITITVPDSGSGRLSSPGGVTITATPGQSITFAKTAGAGLGTLQINGTLIGKTSGGGAQTINTNVVVNSDSGISMQLNGGGTFTNDGLLSGSASSPLSIWGQSGGLTIAGNGTFRTLASGLNAFGIVFENDGATPMVIAGNVTLDGSVSSFGNEIDSQNAGGSIIFNPGVTMTSVGPMLVRSQQVTFGAGSVLTDTTTGAAIIIDSMFTGHGLTITSPSGGSATVSTNGGTINIGPVTPVSPGGGSGTGYTLLFNRSAAGAATLNLNGGPVITTTDSSTTTVTAGVSVLGNNDMTWNVNSGTLSLGGIIRSSKSSAAFTINSTGGLTINGNGGSFGVTGAGTSNIDVNVAAGNVLNVTGTLTIASPGDTVAKFNAVGSDVSLAAGATINAGIFGIDANNLLLGAGSSINTGSYCAILSNIVVPSNAATSISTGLMFVNASIVGHNPGVIFFGDSPGTNFSITRAAGGGTGTLNLNATSGIGEFSRLATTTIGANVALSVNAPSIQFNVDGGTFTDNGTITQTAAAGAVYITSTSSLVMNGTPGPIATTGGGATVIQVSAAGASQLSLQSSYTLNSGAGGSVLVASPGSGGSISLSGGATITALGGALTVSTPTLSFANGSGFSGPSVAVNSGGGANPLTITGPASGVATIATTGGALTVVPTANQALNFSKAAGASTFTLNLNGGPVTLQTTGAAVQTDAGVALASNNNMTITAGGALTLNGSASAVNLTLRTAVGSAGSITLGGNANANNLLLVSADGAGTISRTGGTLTAPLVTLTSGSGDIGTNGANVFTAAGTLSATTAGNVFLNQSGAVTLNASSAGAGKTLQLTSSGTITTAGLISAQNVTLQGAAGSAAGIVVGANITAGNGAGDTLKLAADGAGSITTTSGLLTGNTIRLSSGSGSIGTGGAPINTAAANLAGTTGGGGSVYLNQTGVVNLLTSAAGNSGGTFQITDDNNLTIGNPITGSNITIQTTALSNGNITIAANPTAGSILTISAGGSGQIIQSAGTFTAPTINLSSGTGDIGAVGVPIQTAASVSLSINTNGNVYARQTGATQLAASHAGVANLFDVRSTGTITTTGLITAQNISLQATAGSAAGFVIGADITGGAAAGNTITVAADGAGTITTTAGTLTANTVSLSSATGDIGAPAHYIQVASSNLSASTTGNIYISQTGGVVLTSASGNSFNLIAGGPITVAGALNAQSISLQTTAASSGDINLNASITTGVNGSVSLNAGGAGNINWTAGLITTYNLNMTSGSGNIGSPSNPIATEVNSATASGITGSTTGSFYVNEQTGVGIGPIAVGGSLSVISGRDIQMGGAISGANVILRTTGAFSPSTISVSFPITGTTSVSINSAGNISRSGTGAVSAPNVQLSATGNIGSPASNLQTTASSTLQVVAGGDAYVRQTGAITLLASSAGNSNTFQLTSSGTVTVSGAVSGQTVTLQGLAGSGAGFVIGAGITAGGAAGNTLKISADSAGTILSTAGLLTADTVILTSGSGSIGSPANPINTSANILTGSTGGGGSVYLNETGSVSLVASGAGPSGTFQITDAGNILLSSPISGSNVTVQTTAASNGNITLSANGSAGSVLTIAAGGAGQIVRNAGTLTAPTINLSSGSGDIGTSAAPIQTAAGSVLSANSNGNVYLNQTGAVQIGASHAGAGQAFQLTSSAAITTSGTITGGTISFSNGTQPITVGSNVTASGLLTLAGGVTTVTGNLSSTGADVVIDANTVTVNGTVGSVGNNVQIAGTGNLTISGNGSLSAGGTNMITAPAGSTITLSGSLTSSGTTTFATTTGTGALNVTNNGSFDNAGTIALSTTGGAIRLVNNGLFSAGNGQLNIAGDQAVTISSGNTTSSLKATGGINVSSSGASVSITQGSVDSSSVIGGSAAGSFNVTTTGAGLVSVGGIAAQNTVDVDAQAGSVNVAGSIAAGADATISAQLNVTVAAGNDVSAGTLTGAAASNPFSTNLSDYDSTGIAVPGDVTITATAGSITLNNGSQLFSAGGSTRINAAQNVTTNSATLFAQGGNIGVNALNGALNMTGGSITAVARLVAGAAPVVIDNQSVPAYRGGSVVLWSGSNVNFNSTWSADANGRVSNGTNSHIDPAATTTGSGFQYATGSGYISLVVTGGGSLSVTGSTLDANGGTINIDPTNTGIAGVSILAVAPALTGAPPPPPPPPVSAPPPVGVIPLPPPPLDTTVTLSTPTPGLGQTILPPAATILPTDSTKETTSAAVPAGFTPVVMTSCIPVPMTAETEGAEAWSVAAGSCQSFAFASKDGTSVTGSGGTAVAQSGPNQLDLKKGKVVVVAGTNGLAVRTEKGTVNLPASSSAVIDRQRPGVLRVECLTGSGATISVGGGKQGKTMSAGEGQELVIADDGTSDEELIPVDGVERVSIEATIKIADVWIQKNKFDRRLFAEKETLINCMYGCVPVHVRNQLKKLKAAMDGTKPASVTPAPAAGGKANVSLAPAPSVSANHYRPIAQVSGAASSLPPGLNTVGTGSASVRYLKSSRLSFANDSTIKLSSGDVVVAADRATTVLCGESRIELAAGAVAVIKRDDADSVSVATLWQDKTGDVRAIVGNHTVPVAAGCELLSCKNARAFDTRMARDYVGRRRIHTSELPGGTAVMLSEVSFVSMVGASPALARIFKSENESDRALAKKLAKMAVVLSIVTGAHGPYMPVKSP